MTDLRGLQHFVTVYRTGSFRVAADQLGISQSALTKSIQKLEGDLGVQLFHRTTRRVEPSATARDLLSRAEAALAAASAFEDDARLLAGGEMGAIRVGAIALAAETVVVGGLAELAKSHPQLQAEVVVGSSDVYQDLARGECDVVIGDEANFAASKFASALRKEPLYRDPLVLVHRVGHPAAHARSLQGYDAAPLAIPSRYFDENQLFRKLAAHAPQYRLNSLSACFSLAASSDVVTVAPASAVQRWQASGDTRIQASAIALGITVSLVLVSVARTQPSARELAFYQACVRSLR